MSYLVLLLQTAILEFPIYFVFLAWQRKLISSSRLLILVFMMNAVTHSAMSFGLASLPLTALQVLLIGYGFSILAEGAILYFATGKEKGICLLASLMANLISWQLTPILNAAFFGDLLTP